MCPSYEKNSDLREFARIRERCGSSLIVGQSSALRDALCKLPRIAVYDVPVLVQGETGTGKEVIARAIHYLSPRRGNPFVALPCGACPVDLLENELFGHEAGAYTGASGSQQGLVAKAEGGTLFLDEINSLPLLAQVKILRFLQENEYKPLGAPGTRRANVRIVAACNCDLDAKVREGSFREDLFHRIKGIKLRLPPLREREADKLLLARHFLAKYSQEVHRSFRGFTDAASRLIISYTWPGNVRELENAIRRSVILADGDYIDADEIGIADACDDFTLVPFNQAKREAVDRFEREYLDRLLTMCRGNLSHASVASGKDRKSLFDLARKHNCDLSKYRLASFAEEPSCESI
jgi:two-component system, NtrC family, response regulator GlrR